MRKVIVNIWLTAIFIQHVSSQTCFFDFEDPSEMDNFNQQCNGILGNWIIEDRPETPEPPGELDIGEKVLTNKMGDTSCMRTLKAVPVLDEQTVTIELFYKQEDYSDNAELTISMLCKTTAEWLVPIANEGLSKEGRWIRFSQSFNTEGMTECSVEIKMYQNGKGSKVAIDRMTLEGVAAADCLTVPKPLPPTEETTTLEPTTETPEITTETTPEITTETETTTEITTETETTTEITTETETTTEITTETTTEITTETTSEITTETETTSEITTETDTTSEFTTVTETTPEITTITETTPEITTITETTPEITTDSETTLTSETTTQPTPTSSNTNPPTTEETPPNNYPSFAGFYFVVIIASCSALALASVGLCFLILRISKRSKRKSQYHQY